MKRNIREIAVEAKAYRSYLIRYSEYSAMLDRAAWWIEKDNHFIGHAKDEADARAIIDMLVG